MRLIDCFIELIAYTLYFRKELETGRPSFPEVRERYDRLLVRLEEYRDGPDSFCKDPSAPDSEWPGSLWEDACFAVYAWVDETILLSPWAEKEKWQEEMLQARYFGTTNGGVEFFERLKRLMDRAGSNRKDGDFRLFDTPATEEDRRAKTLEVFSYCLALGFKGKYFPPEKGEELKAMKSLVLERVRGEAGSAFPDRIFLKEYPPVEPRRRFWPRGLLPFSNVLLYLAPAALFGGLYFFYYHFLQNLFSRYFANG